MMTIMTLKKGYKFFLVILITFIVNSCVEPFEAKTEPFEAVLVVEGTITNEIKQQEIKLSRTLRLEDEGFEAENNANVKVVDDTQNEYIFKETTPGKYISTTAFNAQPNKSYQLSITTKSGKTYASKPTKLTEATLNNNLYVSREINKDSINGMAMYIDSFDSTGNSKYYRYEYEETYKIIAPYWYFFDLIAAPEEIDGVYVAYRTQEERICFKTVKSNDIIIKSTNEFGEDRINPFLIRFIDTGNYILSHRYSLLVKQYVLSREAYSYYKTHKDFSESESLFTENQTGFINGNVFSEDAPEEKVIGFFDVSMVFSKRIFFNYTDFYIDERFPPYPKECIPTSPSLEATSTQPESLWAMVKAGTIKFQIENDEPKPGESQYYVVPRICGDCTVLGSNIVPDFWEE
jgi:Domain of unknown function (DUF4249)